MDNDKDRHEKALEKVKPFIQKYQQYSVLSLEDTQALLGQEEYDKLCMSKFYSNGPAEGFIYYWNVAAYISKQLMKTE